MVSGVERVNPLDATLQAACPCVMVPRYEPLALLGDDSHRFLIGGDALYVEVRRPWIHAILKVTDSPVPLPYGQPPALFSINLHRRALVGGLQHFVRQARDVSPLEHAAWLTFDPVQMAVGYTEPQVISRGEGHILYHRPDATARCLPVVDCHSHGFLPAFFSGTDERDDRTDDAKLAFVVGNLDQPRVTITMRFVGFGLSLDLSEWVSSILYADPISNETELGTENHE